MILASYTYRVIVTLLLLGWFHPVNAETTPEERYITICAAANALVSSRLDGIFKDAIADRAQGYAVLLEKESRGQIEDTIRQISETYNEGAIEWSEVVEIAQECPDPNIL